MGPGGREPRLCRLRAPARGVYHDVKDDWLEWHAHYDDPTSPHSIRLAEIQRLVHGALDRAAPDPIVAISICAGQGRDLLGVLARHPRRADVTARLVEADARNAAVAEVAARSAGLEGIDVVVGDGAVSDAYAGAVPADLVLACGVLGNLSDADVERTIRFLPALCATRATVIWTRHRMRPDLTPAVRGWFADSGFEEVAFVTPLGMWGVGAHRLIGPGAPFTPGVRMFTFQDPTP